MHMIEQQVRERAYYIWEGEGRIFGRAEAHWLQAEAELAVTAVEAERSESAAQSAETPVEASVEAAVKSPAKAGKAPAKAAKAPAKAAKAPAKTAKAKRGARATDAGVALH